MNEHKILRQVREYSGILSLFFMIIGAIFGIVVRNKTPALIAFLLFAIFITIDFTLDSYFYYKDMNLKKGQNRNLLIAIIFEIILWILIAINFSVTLLCKYPFIYKIICNSLIVISSFCSIFFADLENCNHDKGIKLFICILYTIGIILSCAASL